MKRSATFVSSSGMHKIAKHILKAFKFHIASPSGLTFKNCVAVVACGFFCLFIRSVGSVLFGFCIRNGSNGKLLTSAPNSLGLAQVSGEVCAILSRI